MKKICLAISVIFLLCFNIMACKGKDTGNEEENLAKTFLDSYFSMEIPGMENEVLEDKDEEDILLSEFYIENFSDAGQEQMLMERYTDSIYQIAKDNHCEYVCRDITLEKEETESFLIYRYIVDLEDTSGASFECKGELYLTQEGDRWLIDGFYPLFDSLIK